jgi:hypothetical protein
LLGQFTIRERAVCQSGRKGRRRSRRQPPAAEHSLQVLRKRQRHPGAASPGARPAPALAAQGMPKGGLVGFELMETQKLGLSQFMSRSTTSAPWKANCPARSQSLASVRRRPGASGDSQADRLPARRTEAHRLGDGEPAHRPQPGPGQIAGIVHLISSSVPNLSNDNVSVIDQEGSLLTKKPDPPRPPSTPPRSSTPASSKKATSGASTPSSRRSSARATSAPRCPPTWTSTRPNRPPKPTAPTPRPSRPSAASRAARARPATRARKACPAPSATSRRCRPPPR